MIALVRREGASTYGYIGMSMSPYHTWNWSELDARLGGPDFLILPNGKMIAGTREYPEDFKQKMILAKVTTEGNFRKLITLFWSRFVISSESPICSTLIESPCATTAPGGIMDIASVSASLLVEA